MDRDRTLLISLEIPSHIGGGHCSYSPSSHQPNKSISPLSIDAWFVLYKLNNILSANVKNYLLE